MATASLHPPRLGVCSWSLRPDSAHDLATKVRATGLSAVQLHLDPLRTSEWSFESLTALDAAGIRIISGMMSTLGEDYSSLDSIRRTGGIRPDQHWPSNLSAARANAAIARRLKLGLVTFHAGFLPHDDHDPLRGTMISRLRDLALVFAEQGVTTALETGQEDAITLQGVLHEVNAQLPTHAAVGINFDPANLILYAMGDPATSLRALAPHVVQIHIKDAVPSKTPGTWGEENRVGDGAVGWPAFLSVIRQLNLQVPLMIEREAGDTRVEDIAHARALLAGAPQ